jgi:hypothetical protein
VLTGGNWGGSDSAVVVVCGGGGWLLAVEVGVEFEFFVQEDGVA